MKEKVSSILKSFLTAYALTTVFHMPLQREHYGETLDYLIASVYELLGTYNFVFILIGVLAFIGYEKHRKMKLTGGIYSAGVAVFLSCCILLGNSFYETDSWAYCFGSIINFLKSALAFCGYFFLLRILVEFLFGLLESGKIITNDKHFFSKHAFGKTFVILSVVYMIVLILSFPGNLCWDVIGQIEQVTVESTGFSQHHPLMHTLLVGGLTQAGELLFGSKEIGLFVYMLVQNLMLITALSATIAVLAKGNVRFGILLSLVIVYCVSPIYTNLASTAIKDIPFVAFVIGYIICLALLFEEPKRIQNPKFAILFIMIQIGTVFMRNNGFPLVVLCGVAGLIFWWKKYTRKERVAAIFTLLVAGTLISKLIILAVASLLNAEEVSKAEMFSLPVQQTARYLVYYEDELSAEERNGIEGVFGDASVVANAYDPDISDPVKALFDNEASAKAVAGYFKAWFIGLCKHPFVYVEAFLNHVYGWFTPSVTSALRYETQYEEIGQGMLFPMADKVVIFLFRFADCVPVLGALQNVGFYVWGLIIISAFLLKKKNYPALVVTVPLWVSLLVCMASPCFFLHPRYALPIVMGLPFVMIFCMNSKKNI